MSSSTAPISIEDQHALSARLDVQRELQIAEEEASEEARRDSTTDSEDGSHLSAGETAKPRRLAVHSEELHEVLDRVKYDKEGGREALTAATRELRERRKEEIGVKGLKGAQEVKIDSTDRAFRQAFYDC